MEISENELTHLNTLIDLIYEGATDAARWTEAILPALTDYIQAPECILFTPSHTPQNGGHFFIHGIAQDHIDRYLSQYIHADVWLQTGIEKNQFVEGNIIFGEELVPREQLLQSTIYKEYLCRDRNMAQLLSCVIFGENSKNTMPTVCSFFRGFHHPSFNETDRKRLRLLLPHLSRSLGVMHRLRTAESTATTTLAALDRLSKGVLLTDSAGEVRFVNRAAQHILDKNDGLKLKKHVNRTGLGQLTANNTLLQRVLSAALRSTLDCHSLNVEHFSDSVLIPGSSGQTTYVVEFSALGNQNEFGDSSRYASIIFLTAHTHQITVDLVLLKNTYHLTPSEVRVAIALLECCSVPKVADHLDISPYTVRTHLKHIYAKLDVDTRIKFVKVMLGLAKTGQSQKASHLS